MHRVQSTTAFSTRIRSVATLLVLIFGLQGMVPVAMAGMLPSTLISAQDARASDIVRIQQALETKVVQHRLAELGFTTAEIEERIAFASNEELHQLASQSEVVLAGGDGGILVTILVVVLLIILIQRIVATETAPADVWMV